MVVRPSAGTGVLDKPGHCSLTPYNFRKYDFNSLFNGRISCKKVVQIWQKRQYPRTDGHQHFPPFS